MLRKLYNLYVLERKPEFFRACRSVLVAEPDPSNSILPPTNHYSRDGGGVPVTGKSLRRISAKDYQDRASHNNCNTAKKTREGGLAQEHTQVFNASHTIKPPCSRAKRGRSCLGVCA